MRLIDLVLGVALIVFIAFLLKDPELTARSVGQFFRIVLESAR